MVESHPAHDSGRIFVGRHREMVELTASQNDAFTGHGRMVVLAGEPGKGPVDQVQGPRGNDKDAGTGQVPSAGKVSGPQAQEAAGYGDLVGG